MKTKKTILMLGALAAVCLASCDKNEEINTNDGKVRFSASIGRESVATPQSRASGTEWHTGDEIGIFMVGHGTTDIAENSNNRQFTTGGGTDRFTPVTGSEMYYPMDNSAVDFIAYYPYTDKAQLNAALPVEIPTVQTDESQRDTDLMWAKANNSAKGYTKEGSADPVALTFGHCLAKLTMNCTVDASVGDAALLDAATVTIHGMHTANTFDLSTGTLSGTAATPANITSRKLDTTPTNFHGTYDAIILPATYADGVLTVDFTLDGETYVWDVKAIEFKPGHEYIYKVLITRTEVVVTGTIAPWMPVEDKNEVKAE